MLSPLEQHAYSHEEGGSDPLDSLLMRVEGYDYTGGAHQFAAVDPTTKALLFKGVAEAVTDHGALTGLADDDHIAYFNVARHTLVVHTDLGLLPLSGGELTDFLTLHLAPTADLHASTKKYVDDHVGGGVTDHGALTGLGGDDHNQYYNQARGDARYQRLVTKAKCFVRLSSDQAVVKDVTTKITFDTEDVDVGSNFNTSLNRFVTPNNGYYQIAAQLWIDGQVMNKLYKVKIRINNTYTDVNVMGGVGHTIDTDPGDDTSPVVFWPVKYLNTGDFVELVLIHHSGATINVHGTENYPGHKTWMSIIEL